MRRSIIIGLVISVLAAGCGGGTDDAAATTTEALGAETTEAPTTTTTTEAATTTTEGPAEFLLGELDNGSVLRVHPGDAITMRLPIEDPADPLWIIAKEPDAGIVQISDSLLWTPSEPGAEPTHFEFVFLVVGTGETSVTFSLGPVTPTSTTIGFSIQSD